MFVMFVVGFGVYLRIVDVVRVFFGLFFELY